MTLRADKGQLGQVLLNLCVNARDAMPKGGRIELALRRVQVTAGIRETTALAPGPYLELTVADTGSGMPPEVVGRLFEPFFSTKGVGKGTGLGLSVVYGIIRQHKGTIRVKSEPGRGTTFVILLPASEAAELPATTPVPAPAVSPAGHGLILLAEDDPSVRDFTMRLLKRHGFDVVIAQDGEEALAVLQRQAAQIRLAILDVVMPRRSGREVFDRIRAAHPHIRVLFCSGYAADMLPAEIRPDGTVALIRKPYTMEELLLQVNRLLDV
jgi:CheY-like chemotaxis protein